MAANTNISTADKIMEQNLSLYQDEGQVTSSSTSNLMTSILTQQVTQTKLLASLILFIITLICGYLPVRILLNQSYIQYAMFAGGGVLMATAFCHLIPEAHDNYKAVQMQLSENSQTNHMNDMIAHSHHHGHSHAVILGNPLASNQSNGTDPSGSAIDPVSAGYNIPYLEATLCCGFFFMYVIEQLMVRFINNHTHEHPCDTSMGQLVVGVSGDTGSTGVVSTAPSGATNLSRSGSSTGTASTEFYKFIRGLLIVSAFGAHSIFDGVAIGSQESVEKVWTIFLAISCHKLIIAAVVGLELYTATLESHLWTLVHLSIFSIMSPIGIILVVVAQNSLHINSNHPAMILLQSFATGTLLYIVFVEILQPKEDQAYEKNRFGKSISLIAGFALMLLVLTLIDE